MSTTTRRPSLIAPQSTFVDDPDDTCFTQPRVTGFDNDWLPGTSYVLFMDPRGNHLLKPLESTTVIHLREAEHSMYDTYRVIHGGGSVFNVRASTRLQRDLYGTVILIHDSVFN